MTRIQMYCSSHSEALPATSAQLRVPLMAFSSLSLAPSIRTIFFTVRSFCSLPTRLTSPLLVPKPLAICSDPVGLSRVRSHRSNYGILAKASTATTERAAMARKVFDTEEDLAVSLAKYTADLSDKFSEERGSFCLVLSGGSLVKSLRKLVEPPYIDSVEWSRWRVFWLDERVVPKNHEDCNYKMAYDYFLSQVPILPGNVYAINEALSAEGAADDYETCLRHLMKCGVIDTSAETGLPKFDLVLMGIDSAGRTTEVRPHPFLQEDNGKWVTFTKESPTPPTDIITLTFPVINSSAYIAMVTNTGKSSSLHTSVENSQNSAVKMPTQWVSPQGELTWFLVRGCS